MEFMTQVGEMISLIVVFGLFLILFRKFAWGPIMDTIEERQQKIEDGFTEIKKLQEDASESHKKYEEKLNEIKLGGFKLGFWIAQQGSIVVFIFLILSYAILMDKTDKKFGVDEKPETGGDEAPAKKEDSE